MLHQGLQVHSFFGASFPLQSHVQRSIIFSGAPACFAEIYVVLPRRLAQRGLSVDTEIRRSLFALYVFSLCFCHFLRHGLQHLLHPHPLHAIVGFALGLNSAIDLNHYLALISSFSAPIPEVFVRIDTCIGCNICWAFPLVASHEGFVPRTRLLDATLERCFLRSFFRR